MHRLHDSEGAELPPKARLLGEAAARGLPVPEGIVHDFAWTDALEADVASLLAEGPVIVRATLDGEDGPERAAAGLGLSVPDCDDLEAVRRAFDAVDASRRDPWLVRYRGGETRPLDRVLIQRQVTRRALLVGALLPNGTDYVEVHGATTEALAQGSSPTFAGVLERWSSASAVAPVTRALRDALPLPEHGFDVELIVDPDGVTHLVQVRPLTRDLVADGTAFVEAVLAAGDSERMTGLQVLDAEHNPAPLSPAHASLIAWLAEQRPASGGLTTLAGWLYVRKRVRELSGTSSAEPLSATDALVRLRDEELPAARARLGEVEASTPTAALDRGLAAFLAMIDVYLGVLLPVRAAAGKVFATSSASPLTLRERAAHADVLPSAWDVAAPPLGELASFTASNEVLALPTDPVEAAVLLTEWDDHLFALGLAAVRAAYRISASTLGMGDEVFGLALDDLRRALQAPGPQWAATAEANLARTREWAALRPPLMLDEGRPLPLLPHRLLHGAAIGDDFEGPIAQRSSLEHLLRDPPPARSIVVLPALTAQAALALESLSLRAICCEHGGALSHASLMLRELGMNGLIGCAGCTDVPDGTEARIDVTLGRLQIASSVTLGS